MPPPCRNPANIERNLQEKARATRQALIVKKIKSELGLPARFGEEKLLKEILEFIQMAKGRRATMKYGAQLGWPTEEHWGQENVAPSKMTVNKRYWTARYNPLAVPSRQPLTSVQEPQEGFNWTQPSTSIQASFYQSSPADVQAFCQQKQMLEGKMTYNLHPLMAQRVSQMINQNTVSQPMTPEVPMVQTMFVPQEQTSHGFYYPYPQGGIQQTTPPVVENQDVMWPSQSSYENAGFFSTASFSSSWSPDSPIEYPSFEQVDTTGMDGSLTNTNPSNFDAPPEKPSLGSMFNHLCQNLFADGVF